MANRRKIFNGENKKQDDVELNRNIVLFRLITTNIYDFEINKKNKDLFYNSYVVNIHFYHDNNHRFLRLVFQ